MQRKPRDAAAVSIDTECAGSSLFRLIPGNYKPFLLHVISLLTMFCDAPTDVRTKPQNYSSDEVLFCWCVVCWTQALEDCGILKNIKRVAGSSAGAICAGLLAVGCTAQEIADVFKCDMKWLFHGIGSVSIIYAGFVMCA